MKKKLSKKALIEKLLAAPPQTGCFAPGCFTEGVKGCAEGVKGCYSPRTCISPV